MFSLQREYLTVVAQGGPLGRSWSGLQWLSYTSRGRKPKIRFLTSLPHWIKTYTSPQHYHPDKHAISSLLLRLSQLGCKCKSCLLSRLKKPFIWHQKKPRFWFSSVWGSDVNRGSKNRNSLQFRVLEIEFLNSKLDFTFWISANVTISTLIN